MVTMVIDSVLGSTPMNTQSRWGYIPMGVLVLFPEISMWPSTMTKYGHVIRRRMQREHDGSSTLLWEQLPLEVATQARGRDF